MMATPGTQNLEEYRVVQYVNLGFTLEQAQDLADIYQLQVADVRSQYINKGCSPELAYRILKS